MPESVQEQTISKRYGRQITDNELPLDNDRRIIVNGGGCCSIAVEHKRSEELLDYYIEMMKWLEPREIITGVAAWAAPDLFVTRVEYATTGLVVWIAGGSDCKRQEVNVEVSTSLGKIKLVSFVIETQGTADTLALIAAEDDEVTVGSNVPPAPEPVAHVVAYPSSIIFPETAAVSGQVMKPVVLKNEGTATAIIESITIAAPFTQQNAGITQLEPGEFTQIEITYSPQDVGSHLGQLEVGVLNNDAVIVNLSGTADSAHKITTLGNQLIRTGGMQFRLKSVNWFGAETDVYAPHGLWVRNYKDLIDQIKAMGFNSVRLPFSGDVCDLFRRPQVGTINSTINSELDGLTSIEVFDKIIAYLNESELYVILDHHRGIAGDGPDGSPVSDVYSYETWLNHWLFMVNRYKHLDYVLGADVHNEPYLLEWDMWASFVEGIAKNIHTVAPHWLIFVEGVGTHGANSYWWGGELSGVATRQIKLTVPNRLVYSVHEYGQSAGQQDWLARDGYAPAQWPLNLYSVWRQHWGFIFEQNIAPIWIGEVGGKFGVDGSGNVVSDSNSQYERQWIYHLQRYMDGYHDGSAIRQLDGDDQGISFAYWSLNPSSGDTGGILQDDWTTEQSTKLELIGMMLNNMALPLVLGLSPLDYSDVDDSSQIIINQDGVDHAINFTALKDAMRMRIYEAGEVHFFNQDVDVAARYAGQVWSRVPGADKVIRIAKADDSNIGEIGGSNNVMISEANLPNVQIDVTGTISSTDLGTKTTTSNGDHTHGISIASSDTGSGALDAGSPVAETVQTGLAGAHTHDITLGSHGHNLTDAKTAALGSGTQLNVTNEYITLAAWFRVS